ncbi:hypothetical protein LCI18_002544 [Fusarium solani-melongenae]|uniref:Uncharacterized protein n=1 Tax=Fusarium solani subsp. cucurbitae TaxID=2747967 RepID=A0ACD3YRK2_FUSSC|nr:hypothetical protein LCI18_002544 [Fusarium solani-melongenae]
MPIHGAGILDWGHKCGGDAFIPQLRRPRRPNPYSPFNRDPYKIPSILNMFCSTVRLEYHRIKIPALGIPVNTDGDVFERLPNELIEAILVNLPRKDVWHLRRASPVYANYQLPEAFWASGFRKGHEFHHVFETFQSRPDSWRNLYLSLRSIEENVPALVRRKRIWGMALELGSLLTQMSGTVSQLWVSFTKMNGGFFVSGFRFVGLDGQVNRLGYIHPNQEVKICCSDERHQSPYSISGCN